LGEPRGPQGNRNFTESQPSELCGRIGYLKEKSSTWIAQNVERKARNFLGHKLWARGYFVSRTPEMADKLQLKPPHKVQSLVPESFITAFGGSHSNPQLCWGLLIFLLDPHSKMPNMNLSRTEAADIAAYIHRLQ
jgi:hypothetical protein